MKGELYNCLKCNNKWYSTGIPEKCPSCLRVNFDQPKLKRKYITTGAKE